MNEKEGQVTAQNSIKKLLEEDAEKENQLVRTIKKVSKSLILCSCQILVKQFKGLIFLRRLKMM